MVDCPSCYGKPRGLCPNCMTYMDPDKREPKSHHPLCDEDGWDHPDGGSMTLPIGDRIRQAHAEHVAAVDPWEGADSVETKTWRSPLTGGVQVCVVNSYDYIDPDFTDVAMP
jgi:hypothetical protein